MRGVLSMMGNDSLWQYLQEQNVQGFIAAGIILQVWVEGLKLFSRYGHLASWHRRKVLHVLTGPIFILTWPMFTSDREGSLYAASLPLLLTTKFALIGLGLLKDEDAVQSMSRSRGKEELLKGPLIYGLVFVTSTLLYWKQPRAIIALFILCFGDGFAEIFGRNFGTTNRIPWSTEKSFAGTFGFILSSTVFTSAFILLFGQMIFGSFQFINMDASALITRTFIVSLLAGLGELSIVCVFIGLPTRLIISFSQF